MHSPLGDASLPSLASRVSAALGDGYILGDEIGAGAQATVFLARDVKHERSVAVKVLRQELASTVNSDRFLREILIAAGLTHPNILPVFTSGSEQGLLYYVMPFVEGETLAHRLEREGRLPLSDAYRLAREIAAALQHAHDRGVVHRDIKPANVLLSGGLAVVADFGLARALEPTPGALELTSEHAGLGTPYYMSPEQALGAGEVDASSDQYGLACVLFEMLTGRHPYEGPTFQALLAQHVTAPPPNAKTFRPEVPERVAAAIIRALAKSPGERFPSVKEFVAEAAAVRDRTSAVHQPEADAGSTSRRRLVFAGAVVATALAVAAWQAWGRIGGAAAGDSLDKNLVAVAPFAAPEPQLEVWREGLAEVVARNLDGAGPLRSVSMTVINQSWKGANDPRAIRDLGRSTGAASAVSGTLLRSGADSVSLTATVYDVAGSQPLGEVHLTEETVQIGRLAERLTLEVLRLLGQSQRMAEARMVAARSTPLPALKAFLQGEHYFRRTAWDSAMVYYQRAVDLDSTMALAYLRMSMVAGWQRYPDDALARQYAQRAAALNHGLAPRESLLVHAEGLKSVVNSGFADRDYPQHVRDLFQTLDAATTQYPDDRELWYSLGNARAILSMKVRGALKALDRAIAIDSGFAPPYLDAVYLAMATGSTDAARRYLRAYLALNPTDVHGDGLRLASQLLDERTPAAKIQSVLDTASGEILVHAIDVVSYWPDSGESAVRLARLLGPGRRTSIPRYAEPKFTAFQLAYPLAFRGHLREAYALSPQFEAGWVTQLLKASLVMMNALPRREGAVFFDSLSRKAGAGPTGSIFALPWWSEHHDTAALRAVAERAEADAAKSAPGNNAARYSRHLGAASRAYLTLARGDTANALTALLALGPTDCIIPFCPYEPLQAAILLSQRGRLGEAWKILDDIPNIYNPIGVRWRLERGRVAERLGRRDDAISAYTYVAAVWKSADEQLQPAVREALAGLQRLGAPPQR
ncbi:MAG: serine/threonine-protein kinase [Gemmatimonadota bacterium]